MLQTANARRHEEESAWRHPDDLTVLLRDSTADWRSGFPLRAQGDFGDAEVDALAWELLSESPRQVVGALDLALDSGASPEQLARAVAYAAALRILRFHTQNDHGDWNEVHHAFTASNAMHQAILRSPSPELVRGVYQCALRVYLDRFLNVPAARHLRAIKARRTSRICQPAGTPKEGSTRPVASSTGSSPRARTQRGVIAALGHQLLTEDSGLPLVPDLRGRGPAVLIVAGEERAGRN